MDWPNERYVRLYIRDTLTWSMWPWESRALFALLLRKLDRAGVLDIGKHDPVKALAVVVDMPPDIVRAGLEPLVASGTVEVNPPHVVMPGFMEAQEARASGAQRQREYISRRRAKAVSPNDKTSDKTSPARHSLSQTVTPSLAKPSLKIKSDSKSDPDKIQGIWDYFNAKRASAVPGSRTIRLTDDRRRAVRKLLKAGYTGEDVRAVVDICARGCNKPEQRQWFNASTPFRPENFARLLGQVDTKQQDPEWARGE